MNLKKAQKLIKKLYYEIKQEKIVSQREVNELGDFMHNNRFKVLIIREYGVDHNPQTKTLEMAHYPVEVYSLYGYLHCEKFQSGGIQCSQKLF